MPRGGVEVWLYSFFNLGPRWGCVVNATPRPLYPRERDPAYMVQETGMAQRPVWTCEENLALTGIRSPDRPALRHSLYRLSYRIQITIGRQLLVQVIYTFNLKPFSAGTEEKRDSKSLVDNLEATAEKFGHH